MGCWLHSVPVGGSEEEAVADLRLVYSDLVRFEIELWGAVEARLRAECDLQLTWFEVMRLPARPGRA